MKTKRTKWVVILVAVVALAVAGKLLLGGSGAPQYAQTTAQTGTIETYFNFSGTVDVNQSVTVTAPGGDDRVGSLCAAKRHGGQERAPDAPG